MFDKGRSQIRKFHIITNINKVLRVVTRILHISNFSKVLLVFVVCTLVGLYCTINMFIQSIFLEHVIPLNGIMVVCRVKIEKIMWYEL